MVAVRQPADPAGERAGSVRPAVRADQPQIANLLYFEEHVHRHLDWRGPLDWLGAPHYWVFEQRGQILAALACPQDPPGIAWIRLFAHASPLTASAAWSPLWEAVRAEIVTASACAAAIALQPWFESLLIGSQFQTPQRIVLLEWKDRPAPDVRIPPGIAIRRMQIADLPHVAETDSASFTPLWRNSLAAFQRAYSQAILASVAEDQQGLIVGYQLSTGNPFGAHLARLAVRPEAQGQGVGEALVGDLIYKLRQRGPARLTVNTQDDNKASLSLYEKIGFVRTGETFPVLTFRAEEA